MKATREIDDQVIIYFPSKWNVWMACQYVSRFAAQWIVEPENGTRVARFHLRYAHKSPIGEIVIRNGLQKGGR